ncbi:hypothetical protein CPC08DRAFT_469726 [Agrocybe pediades]|nr:hypothetical protein CPC08DRAFT_469726 [Agrocybe pediades]
MFPCNICFLGWKRLENLKFFTGARLPGSDKVRHQKFLSSPKMVDLNNFPTMPQDNQQNSRETLGTVFNPISRPSSTATPAMGYVGAMWKCSGPRRAQDCNLNIRALELQRSRRRHPSQWQEENGGLRQ